MSPMPDPTFSTDRVRTLPVDGGLADLEAELLGRAARRPRWPVVALAAAASVAVVVAVPAVLSDDTASRPAAPAATTEPPVPTPTPQPDLDPTPTPAEPAVVVEPWDPPPNLAVLEADGWTVDPTLVDSGRNRFSVTYHRGSETFELGWERTTWYAGSRREAERDSGGATIDVLGTEAVYVTYDSQQQMAYLPEVDGWGLRVDAAFTVPSTFEYLVTQLRAVGPAGIGEAMPASVLGPDELEAAVEHFVDGAELPPEGYAPPRMTGWKSPYHVAATIVQDVACGWAELYGSGGTTSRQLATEAIEGSSAWPLLTEPPVSWPGWLDDMGRAMKRGEDPLDVLSYEGCPGGRRLPHSIS